MKRFALFVAAALTLGGCAAESRPVQSAVKSDAEPLRVLFAGDSITVGRDASSRETSFASLMVEALGAEGTRIGNSGRTAAEVATEVIDAPTDVDVVVVELGTNDVYRSTPAQFAVDYPELLDSIRAASPDAALLCAGVWQSNPVQLSMDNTIRRECEKRGGRFASLAALYADKTNRACQTKCVRGQLLSVLPGGQIGSLLGNWIAKAFRAWCHPWVPVPSSPPRMVSMFLIPR